MRSQKEESYLVDESKENGNHDENTDKNLQRLLVIQSRFL